MARILVAEDDVDSRALLDAALRGMGFIVDNASNGAIALKLAQQTPPDLIISDGLMPEMDGFDFCRAVKDNVKLSAIPFIFYTATYADERDKKLALTLGACQFLRKPMEITALLEIIAQTLYSRPRHQTPAIGTLSDSNVGRMHEETLTRKLDSKIRQLSDERQALKKSELRYQDLLENAHDLILGVAANGSIIFVNKAWRESLRYGRHEISQLSVNDFVHANDLVALRQAFNNIFTGEDAATLECRFITKKGGELFVEGNCTPFRSDTDAVSILGIFRDVTERARTEKALRASEEKFSKAFHSIPNAVTISTINEGRIVDVNAGFEQLVGYKRDEATGRTLSDLSVWVSAEEHERFAEMLKNQGFIREEEAQFRHKNGEFRTCLVSAEQVEIDQQACIICATRDITESRILKEKTRQQELQLIQANKMAALGTLVSGLAHEVNNPNNLVMMNAQSLREIWTDVDKILKTSHADDTDIRVGGLPFGEIGQTVPWLISGIYEGSEKIQKIVDDLKHYVRPTGEKIPQPFSINDAVRGALSLLNNVINKKSSALNMDLAGNLPQVIGDVSKIEQVVVNLVVNALDASPEAPPSITLSTCLNRDTRSIELRVIDQGVGIGAGDMDRITQPFFTTKQKIGGTGLGLAISSTLIEEQGGTLKFKSEPGKGTEATVSLPANSRE